MFKKSNKPKTQKKKQAEKFHNTIQMLKKYADDQVKAMEQDKNEGIYGNIEKFLQLLIDKNDILDYGQIRMDEDTKFLSFTTMINKYIPEIGDPKNNGVHVNPICEVTIRAYPKIEKKK